MENGTLMAGDGLIGTRTTRVRVSAVIAAVALVFAMFVMVQHRADAAPAGAAVAASVASVGSGTSAQLNFNQIICSTLISIRNAFANSPFFSFVVAAINPLIVGFGCSPS
jgi:hypothetical protein